MEPRESAPEHWALRYIGTILAASMAYMVLVGIMGTVGVLSYTLTIWLIFGPLLAFLAGFVLVLMAKMVRDEWR